MSDGQPALERRIVVTLPGSGKSTLARARGRRLDRGEPTAQTPIAAVAMSAIRDDLVQ